ncbi:heme o synthase [Virgibacillus dakarensis]|uniref:heme o synthase n=1 Tax=Virgibacillus dakarensis TaxID=1917889 RepID=UPI000B42FCBD|nr:heme o synthase [Virgibacillus dakarensis]MBT2217354.1 heme o synthase [Virgibacillus dakarensis]
MNKADTPSSLKIGNAHVATKPNSLIADFKELFKAIVLISNVLPVLTGFWLALHFTNSTFAENWELFVLTIVGSTFVMAGALILNNWYDVDIDAVMDRTKKRPTVTGHISLKTVLILGIALSAIGLVILLLTTLEATIYAFIGWFTYVFLYTMWSKRKYTLNTIIGSISGAVTPLIGWAAIEPAYHVVPIVLFFILFIWQIPHTFSIAIKKYDEYKAAGVAMLPVVHGFNFTKRQMVVYIACLLPLPFLLAPLGTTFIVIATALNVGWLILGIRGFSAKDNWQWAHKNFIYSLSYLTILFLMMIVVTLPAAG